MGIAFCEAAAKNAHEMTIDHEQRRRKIAQVCIDVIVREGLEAATIRRIAAEAGFSTTAVTHYFADKQELLLWTYRILAQEGVDQFEAVIAHNPQDIVETLLTMTAWAPDNLWRWKAYLAFWDQAARSPEFATEHDQSTTVGLSLIERLVRILDDGTIDVGKAIMMLNAVVQGISLQVIIGGGSWTKDRVRATLAEALDMVMAGAKLPRADDAEGAAPA
jgi:AcrR family transcriptional regulator